MIYKRPFYIVSFILFLLLILTYSNHFNNGFHFDDSHTVEDNVFIRHLSNIPLFFKDVTTFSTLPSHQNYRPMVTTTLAIDYWIGGGLKPFYFHLSTFIWYIVQCILMFLLFYKILKTVHSPQSTDHRIKYFALFGTAWYAFHTANAETLNYIISRSDTLSTLGVVASLWIYAYYPKLRNRYIYFLPLIFGLFAKETAFTFFGLLFFYVILFEKQMSVADIFNKKNFKAVLTTVRVVLPAVIICILFAYLNIRMMSKEYVAGGSRYYYLITQPFVILHYFFTFFLPVHLSADTDLYAFTTIFDIRFFLGGIFLIAMFWLIFYTSSVKELKPAAFGLIWFFIALLPTSSFIPLSEVLNDHRIFYPFIGLALASANIIYYLYIKFNIQHSAFIIAFALIVISANAYGVYQRNKVWHDEESLWRDVTVKSPKNGRGLMNYGLTQMSKGNYKEALIYYDKALIYNPNYSYLYVNLGILKNTMNKPEEAEFDFKRAIELDASYYGTYYYYANFLYKHNRSKEAIPLYKKAIELSPYYLYSSYELLQIYYITQQWEDLRSLVEKTLKFAPDDKTALYYQKASRQKKTPLEMAEDYAESNPTPTNYLSLSLQYYQQAQYQKCIDACNKALTLKPDYAEAYNNICSAYNALGKWQDAVNACEKALKFKPDFSLAKGNLDYAKKILNNKNK
jgi:protein O-mannosyl-transferase